MTGDPLDRIEEESQIILEYGIAATPEDVLALVGVARAARAFEPIPDKWSDGDERERLRAALARLDKSAEGGAR